MVKGLSLRLGERKMKKSFLFVYPNMFRRPLFNIARNIVFLIRKILQGMQMTTELRF
jgi:hypothetical protein